MNNIVLPVWLENIIFDEFGGIYSPDPIEVQLNPDKDFDFAKKYLGTYFPRSFAESYYIFSKLLNNPNYSQVIAQYNELKIFDFCSGMGGEIFGLLYFLHEFQYKFPKLKFINIDAYDANPIYLRFLFHLTEKIKKHINIEFKITPLCLFIENESYLHEITKYYGQEYNIVLSCKALNEFIKQGIISTKNIYKKTAEVFLPIATNDGILLLSDVTNKKHNEIYYPCIMNEGLNSLTKTNAMYKTLYPFPCFHFEQECHGCYMQDSVYVTHKKCTQDISKITYRVIGRSDFVVKMMRNICTTKYCRYINPNADKSVPFM